jgi:hypothetical protein
MRKSFLAASALCLALLTGVPAQGGTYNLPEPVLAQLQTASLEGVDALIAAVPAAISETPFRAADIVCYAAGLMPDAAEQIALAAAPVDPEATDAINECMRDIRAAAFAPPPLENSRQNSVSPF